MDDVRFDTILGSPRLLAGAAQDGARRVLAHDGERVIGIAVFEPLFGRQAEGAVATAAGASSGVAVFLLDELVERTRSAGLGLVRLPFTTPSQRALAYRAVSHRCDATIRSDRLELRADSGASIGVRPSCGPRADAA